MRIVIRIAITIAYLILAVPVWAALGILTMPTVIKQIWRGKKKPPAGSLAEMEETFKKQLADAVEKKAQRQAVTDTAAGKPTRADWNKVSYYDLRREGNC